MKDFQMYTETCRLSGGYYQDLAGGYKETEGEHRSAQWKHKAEKEARNKDLNEQTRKAARDAGNGTEPIIKKIAEY